MAEQFNLDGNIKITAKEAIQALETVSKLLTSLHKQLTDVETKFKSSPLIKNIDSKIAKAQINAQKLDRERFKTESEHVKLKAVEEKANASIAKSKFQMLKVDEKSTAIINRNKKAVSDIFDKDRSSSLKTQYINMLQSVKSMSASDAEKIANNKFANIKTNSGLNSIENTIIFANTRKQLNEEQKKTRENDRQNRILERQRQLQGSILDRIFSIKNALMLVASSYIAKFISGLVDVTNRLQAIDIKFKAIAGSASLAKNEMDWIWNRAKSLRVPIMEAAEGYAQFYAAAKDSLPADQVRKIYDSLLQTSLVLHLNKDRFKLASLAFEQMISKGTVSMEELRRQLGEHIPGAFVIAAKAMGTSQKELNELIKGGKLASNEFLIKFAPALIKAFSSAIPEALQSSQSKIQAFLNTITDFQRMFSEGGFADAVGEVADALRRTLESKEFRQSIGHIARIIEITAKNSDKIIMVLKILLAILIGNKLGKMFLMLKDAYEAGKLFTVLAGGWVGILLTIVGIIAALNFDKIINGLARIAIWIDQIQKYGSGVWIVIFDHWKSDFNNFRNFLANWVASLPLWQRMLIYGIGGMGLGGSVGGAGVGNFIGGLPGVGFGLPLPMIGAASRAIENNMTLYINTKDDPNSVKRAVEKGVFSMTGGESFSMAKIGLPSN